LAVSPDELLLPTQDELAKAQELEAHIDQELRLLYDQSGQQVSVHVQHWSQRVVRMVKPRYEAAGWKVADEDDQRDGRYLVLKPAKRTGG
jgi:transketolase